MPGILTYKGPISGLNQASFQWHWGSDGRARTLAYCSTAVTKATPYVLGVSEYGQQAEALGTAGTNVLVGVADESASAGDYAWFIVAGEVEMTVSSDTYALGQGIIVHTDGTVKSGDADYTAAAEDELGAASVAETSAATSVTAYLMGRHVTW